MKRAGRVHGLEVLGLAAFLAALIVGGLIWNRSTHARGLVDQVLKAETAQVPDIVDSMRDYRHWVDPLLKDELERPRRGLRQNSMPGSPCFPRMPLTLRLIRSLTGCSRPKTPSLHGHG